MSANRFAGALVMMAMICWQGAAFAAPVNTPRDQRQSATKPPASSICIARCAEMEARCEAYERESPSCGTADVCFEEREQCNALCRVTASLERRACS